MTLFETPKIEPVSSFLSADVENMRTSNGILAQVFKLQHKPIKMPHGPELKDLGRIARMSMPAGWIAGNDIKRGTSYAMEFHPKSRAPEGEIVEKDNVQIVFSYRGQRLSNSASLAFRELLDNAPSVDAAPRKAISEFNLHRAPLNEVLGERGIPAVFTPAFAEIQRINGEPALVVVGKYVKYDVKAKLIYIDADRNNRTEYGAPVQEIAFIAPADEFYKYSVQANKSLNSLEWQH